MAEAEINLDTTNPQELIGQGIRAYVMGDFANAVVAFGRATQLMAEKYGDEDDSLGEVYIHYAKSLLELSREESGPFGDAIPQGDEDSSDSDEEDDNTEQNSTSQIAETEAEADSAAAVDPNAVAVNGVVQNGKDDNSSSSVSSSSLGTSSGSSSSSGVSSSQNSSSKENSPKKEEQTKEEKDEKKKETEEGGEETSAPNVENQPEDCSDLQLAWEVLEVAKKIYTKRGDNGKERLAEVLVLLGEVAMESENFNDGVNDMTAGLELQKQVYEPTNRKLAETYYKLGTAHSTLSNIDAAVNCFQSSMEILKKRTEMLQQSGTEKVNDEIVEITSLIPEIEEKISDTKSIKEEMAIKLMEEISGEKRSAGKEDEAGPSSSSRPNDISHLVKRKRKSNEDTPDKEILPAKRPTP